MSDYSGHGTRGVVCDDGRPRCPWPYWPPHSAGPKAFSGDFCENLSIARIKRNEEMRVQRFRNDYPSRQEFERRKAFPAMVHNGRFYVYCGHGPSPVW